MGFKRTADGRVFFENAPTQEASENTGSAANAGAGSMQVTGLLKALNERLKEAQLERGRLIRELDEVRTTLTDMAQRTERAEKAYIDLEQQLSTQQNEAFKKAERAERAAKETLGDMLDARNSLSELHERNESREKELFALQEQIAASAKIMDDMKKRQAIVEKFQREHGEKMVDHVAAYVTLSKRVTETQAGFEAIDNKIGDVAARQDNIDRKFEKSHEERVRMLRKIDRIEDAVIQTRDTLNAKAMVVLADPGAAAFNQAQAAAQNKTQAKPWSPQNYEDIARETDRKADTAAFKREPVLLDQRADDENIAWWQKPAVQTTAIAIVLLGGIVAGWAVNEMKNPARENFDLFERFKATQAEQPVPPPAEQTALNEDAWQPVVQAEAPSAPLEEPQEFTAEVQGPAEAQQADQIVDSWSNTPTDENMPIESAINEMDLTDDIGAIDLNDEDSLLKALETNPDALAAQLNAIEPGTAATEETAPVETVAEETAAAPQAAEAAVEPAAEETEIASLPPQEIVKEPAPVVAKKAPEPVKPAPAPVAKTPAPAATTVVKDITPDANLPARVREIEVQALAGVPEAQHDLAALYIAGHTGVPKNYERAAQWFRKAADNGVANARYNLGVLYQQGLGVERSLEDAIKWYTAAARQGHPEAQYNLGIAYIEGIGVPYDPFKAADYFEFAATHGITESAYNLGLIYENGLLGKAEPQTALNWYKKAADGGSPEAKAALEQLAKNLNIKLEDVNRVAATPTASAEKTASVSPAKPSTAPVRAEPMADSALTALIQGQLMRLGLYPGPADGVGGPLTSDAIRSYQAMNGLGVNGEATAELLENMKSKAN